MNGLGMEGGGVQQGLEGRLRRLVETDPRDFLSQVQELLVSQPTDRKSGELRAQVGWHCLAELAARRALSPILPDLVLAQAAIHIYEFLTRASAGSGESFTTSAMILRVGMICRLGPATGSYVLDPDQVLMWVRDALGAGNVQRAERGPPWNLRDTNEWLPYRRIKNQLGVITPLTGLAGVYIDKLTDRWLRLRTNLP